MDLFEVFVNLLEMNVRGLRPHLLIIIHEKMVKINLTTPSNTVAKYLFIWAPESWQKKRTSEKTQ